MSNLFRLLDAYGSAGDQGLYAGFTHFLAPPYRFGKYAVSSSEYGTSVFPPFVAGGAVLFSPDVIGAVIPYFFTTPFKLDDVYIAFLVANANMTATKLPNFALDRKYCRYEDDAVALHFSNRGSKSAEKCNLEIFINMLNYCLDDKFVYELYLKPCR